MITKLTNLSIDLMSIDGKAGRLAADVPMHQGLKITRQELTRSDKNS